MLALIPIKNINRVEFKMLDLMKLFKLDQDKEPEVRNLCFHSNLIKAELPRYMQSQIANILAFLENLLSVTHKQGIFLQNKNSQLSKDNMMKNLCKEHNQQWKKWML
jgi:hypothetical protein